jgi:amidohydrolase
MTVDQERLDALIDSLVPAMIEVRRHLHAHPEPSGEERGTAQFLADRLGAAGLSARSVADQRGLLVDPPEARAGARLGLRADMDALHIHEERPSPYRSQVPGIMHACGHDAHSAIVFGTLLALHQAERAGLLPWAINWRGIFQPAEEINRGAIEMVAAGALEGVAAIFALHVDPSQPVGTIGTRVGAFTAACDELVIHIEGRGGHAARPHESIDPIAAAAQLISSIYLFVPRAVDSQDPVVVTFGQIQGGSSPNVIPDRVVLRGTIRTLGGTVRERTRDHICQLARGLAEVSRARIEITFHPGPQSVSNDPALTALIRQAATDLLGPQQVQEISRASMGGEDFANYLLDIPGCMFRLGCCSQPSGCPPLHSSIFHVDERALGIGAKVLLRSAILWSNPVRGDPRTPAGKMG